VHTEAVVRNLTREGMGLEFIKLNNAQPSTTGDFAEAAAASDPAVNCSGLKPIVAAQMSERTLS
jgi:hypothetical protein